MKTALLGRDPNWGRIAQAAGQALAGEDLRGARAGPDRRRRAGDRHRGGRDRDSPWPRRFGGPRLLLRPHQGLRRAERGVLDVSDPRAEELRVPGRDPARGAAVHPGVPRQDRRHQVRRRGDARGGPARGVRDRRRAAQVRRPQPGDRARRRAGHHLLHGAPRDGGPLPRGRTRLRPGHRRGGEDGPARQGERRHRARAQPPRPARGRPLRRGRRPVPDRPARARPRTSASSATSSASTSTSSTTSPRTTSR